MEINRCPYGWEKARRPIPQCALIPRSTPTRRDILFGHSAAGTEHFVYVRKNVVVPTRSNVPEGCGVGGRTKIPLFCLVCLCARVFFSRQRTRNNYCTNLLEVCRVVKGTDALSFSLVRTRTLGLSLISAARRDNGGYHINSSAARRPPYSLDALAPTTETPWQQQLRLTHTNAWYTCRTGCCYASGAYVWERATLADFGRVLSSRFYRYRPG